MLRKIERRPDPVLVAKYGSLTIAIVAAVAVGWMAAPAKTPHQCTVMATVAEKRAIVQTNLVHVVNARGDALDKDEYRVLNDDVVALESELDPLDADYREAKAACLGGAK